VPICGLWASDTAAPAKHSARVNARFFSFILSPFKAKAIPGVEQAGNYTPYGGELRRYSFRGEFGRGNLERLEEAAGVIEVDGF
jgi:hypothetical protein